MGARSGQRIARLHIEGRVQEEQAESENGKIRKRNRYASEEVERLKAEMDECGVDRKGQRLGQAGKDGENQRIEV
jgi:single-stranded DNA-binding protein